MSRKACKRIIFAEEERTGTPVKRSSDLPLAGRINKLKTFLNNQPCITRKDYAKITGLLKNKAIADLNAFVKEG